MRFSFFITKRDDFIDFARAIGGAVRDRATKEQTIIGFGGDADSGKSLLVFGVDMAFHPERYADGTVPLHASAEKAFSREFNKSSDVVFENFRRPVYLNRESFDRGLREYKAQNPQAKVLCYSNIERTITGEHDFARKGMDSDELDISLRVYNEDEVKYGSPLASFNRHVIVDVPENSPFAVVLEQLARDKRFQETEEHALAELTFSVRKDQLKILRWVK